MGLGRAGSAEAGIGLLRQELATWQALGTKQEVPQVLAELAQVYGKVGHTEDGLRLLAEALPLIRKHEERHYEAEVYRLTGEVLLQQAAGRAAPRTDIVEASAGMEAEWGTTMSAWPIHIEAKRCFLQALDIARRQQAKSWELRAAMSLSRLWQLQGKREAAQQVLRETYDWFTEGFDTADLQEAKALLDEWS
jgi:predicted ATPase